MNKNRNKKNKIIHKEISEYFSSQLTFLVIFLVLLTDKSIGSLLSNLSQQMNELPLTEGELLWERFREERRSNGLTSSAESSLNRTAGEWAGGGADVHLGEPEWPMKDLRIDSCI